MPILLDVIKTHAQINQGWIDTTEQQVVHTINQPSIHSNLLTFGLKRRSKHRECEIVTKTSMMYDDAMINKLIAVPGRGTEVR